MSDIVTLFFEVRVVQTDGRPVTAERAADAVAAHLRHDPIVKVPAVRAGKPATVAVLSAEAVAAEPDERLRAAAKRVLEADMRGDRDLDALNALEDAAGFTQQGQRRRERHGA